MVAVAARASWARSFRRLGAGKTVEVRRFALFDFVSCGPATGSVGKVVQWRSPDDMRRCGVCGGMACLRD